MNAKIKKLMERRAALEAEIEKEQQAERERRIQALVSVADRHGLLDVEAARLGSIITRVAREVDAQARADQSADRGGEAGADDVQKLVNRASDKLAARPVMDEPRDEIEVGRDGDGGHFHHG